jgi:isopentenyl phosphate kinase
MGKNSSEIVILKIGGSVITEKSKGVFDRLLRDEMERVADEISFFDGKMILVHGAGSFGHPYVEKYRLKKEKNREGIIKTHLACKRLNTAFCEVLADKGVFPYPIHPFTSFLIDSNLAFDTELFIRPLNELFTPVTHGDMVYNVKNKFFEVLSGDKIVSELIDRFKDFELRVGLATDTDGVYMDGEVLEEINDENFSDLKEYISQRIEEKSDVTGGMMGKIAELFGKSRYAEIRVFNGTREGEIKNFLRGKSVGTLLRKRR